MPSKGRRIMATAPSPLPQAVANGHSHRTRNKEKRETKTDIAGSQNGLTISTFFKPLPPSDEDSKLTVHAAVTPVKVNGVASSLPTANGSANKHIIQVPTDVDVVGNGVQRRTYTRSNRLSFTAAFIGKEEPSLLSDKPEDTPKIITKSDGNSRKLTDYFPIRRSGRLTRSRLNKMIHSEVEEALINGTEEGLIVEHMPGKGRGIVASKAFKRGEFVVEYAGELITTTQARQREVFYAQDQNKGCYMYYFLHNNRRYCVDATEESGRLGRLVNHSRSNSNLLTKTFMVNERPRLILVAKRDIEKGEELLYDYGDRSKLSLEAHPWLAT